MNPLLFYEYGLDKATPTLPFVSTWKTDNISTGSSSASQIKLPLIPTGNYNMIVDWGDGTTSRITSYDSPDAIHTYAAAGNYTISINGDCTGWQFNRTGDCLKLLSITQWGIFKLGTNEGGYFYGCANLNLSSVIDILDLTGTTSLSNAFSNCTILSTINRLSEWNISSVNNLTNMFNNARAFNQDISAWDTSSVTNMSGMFALAFLFNQPIGNWNTSSVTNMSGMFYTNSDFDQPIDNWDTSKVTDMSGMFSSAYVNFTKFNQSINNWDTSNVVKMNGMFQQAFSFNQPIGNWNTSKVTDMTSMFQLAKVFNQPVGSWNTSNVTKMSSMFYYATSFNQPIGNWDTSSVVDISYMFTGATLFNQPIGGWDTSKITKMTQLFQYCNFNQNIGSWNVSNVINFSQFMDRTISPSNLDAIYNGWSSRPVKPSISITFGSSKYTSASSAARAILAGAPNIWTISDGGITT